MTGKKGRSGRKKATSLVKQTNTAPAVIDKKGQSRASQRKESWDIRARKEAFMRQSDGTQIPMHPRNYIDIVEMSKRDPVTRTCIQFREMEAFRNGLEIKSRFWGKCEQCGFEYEDMPAAFDPVGIDPYDFMKNGIEGCLLCDNGKIKAPDYKEKMFMEETEKCVNLNDKSLLFLLKQLLNHLDVMDDCYLFMDKFYTYDEGDGSLTGTIKGIYKQAPEIMRISEDETGLVGNAEWVCLEHRDHIVDDPNNECNGKHKLNIGLLPMYYAATAFGGMDKEIGYIEGEIIHTNLFYKNGSYGVPPSIALWDYQYGNIRSIKFITSMFDAGQHNQGILAWPGIDQDSIDEMMEEVYEQKAERPHDIPVVSYSGTAKEIPIYIRLMDKLNELEVGTNSTDRVQKIGAFYGVMPIFLADTSTGSGLNNEGEQITVTNKSTLGIQSTFNEEILKPLAKQYGIKDWYWRIKASEEQDLMAFLQQHLQKFQNIKLALELGLKVDLEHKDNSNDFDYKISGIPELVQLFEQGGGNFSSGQSPEQIQNCLDQTIERLRSLHPDWDDSKIQAQAQGACQGKEGQSRGSSTPSQEPTKLEPNPKRQTGNSVAYEPAAKPVKKNVIIRKNIPQSQLIQVLKRAIAKIKEIIEEKIKEASGGGAAATQAAMQAAIPAIAAAIPTILMLVLKDKAQDFVIDGMQAVLKEEAISPGEAPIIPMDVIDKYAFQAFENTKGLLDAFAGLSEELSLSMREVVGDVFKGGTPVSFDEMRKEMNKVVDLSEFRIETIVRTEHQRFYQMGRELEYNALEKEKPGVYKFIWLVRRDKRTSPQCELMDKRQDKEGMPMKELKALLWAVQEELPAKPGWYPSWAAHFNCRSTIMRVI